MTREEALIRAEELAFTNIRNKNQSEIKSINQELNDLFKTFNITWSEIDGWPSK